MVTPHRTAGGLEVADILTRFADEARARSPFTDPQERVLRRIVTCRTAALGGHLDECDVCGVLTPSYNSCRDRHCPKCLATHQARWIAARQLRVLPTPHYHVVFTLPGRLRALVRTNRRRCFGLLFRAASKTLLTFGRDPAWLGAQLGITAVLHTWTRDLRFHPHLHCIVTAGGLAQDTNSWIRPRHGTKLLFPVAALAKVFRGKFLDELAQLWRDGELHFSRQTQYLSDEDRFRRYLDKAHRMRWLVYAKRPFGGAKNLFAYLGRYTHRVAISNQRLVAIDDDGVHFHTKGGCIKTLDPVTFVIRFLDHVLPPRLVKIRHYGLYASANIRGRLERARQLLPEPPAPEPNDHTPDATPDVLVKLDLRALLIALTGKDPKRCKACGVGTLHAVENIPSASRGPP